MLQNNPTVAERSATRTKTMSAAVIIAPRHMEIHEVPMPEPGPGEVRVRLEGCGVCASNLPPWEGRPWFTYPMPPGNLGHEGWGVIDAVGDNVTERHIGEFVCTFSQHAYAEYATSSWKDTIVLPEALTHEPFPGEPLACAMNVFERADIHRGQRIAIVGIGFLGAVLTRLAKAAGARVIAISRRGYALDVARQFEADEVIPMGARHHVVDRVKELTHGALCERVIEAVGHQESLDLVGELVCERGKLIVAGYHQDGLRQVNMQLWNWRGIDVINAHERDPQRYRDGVRKAMEAVASGLLDPRPLYTHRFALRDLGKALEMVRQRPDGFMKALIMI